MSEEEAKRKLEKVKKEREDAYKKFEGFTAGIRAARQLSKAEEDFLQLVEFMMKGFQNVWDDITIIYETQFDLIQRIGNLSAKTSEIEKSILQLRLTLDRMVQDK